MKYKITYRACGVGFSAEADQIARAYEYVKAIVDANQVVFPNYYEDLSEFIVVLVEMKAGTMKAYSNNLFKIEVITE